MVRNYYIHAFLFRIVHFAKRFYAAINGYKEFSSFFCKIIYRFFVKTVAVFESAWNIITNICLKLTQCLVKQRSRSYSVNIVIPIDINKLTVLDSFVDSISRLLYVRY